MADFPFLGSGESFTPGADVSVASAQPDIEFFNASTTYTIPATGVYRMLCVGGGGNGGSGSVASGGGAGGLSYIKRIDLSEGTEVQIIVGAQGGQSQINIVNPSVSMIANGGQDGLSGASLAGGAGGTASGGDVNNTGGAGGDSDTFSGGGGGVNYYGRDTKGGDGVSGAGGGGGVGGRGATNAGGGAGGDAIGRNIGGPSLGMGGGNVFQPLGGGTDVTTESAQVVEMGGGSGKGASSGRFIPAGLGGGGCGGSPAVYGGGGSGGVPSTSYLIDGGQGYAAIQRLS